MERCNERLEGRRVVLLLVILLSAATLAGAGEHINSDLHYSFTLPDDWIEIPEKVLTQTMLKAAETTEMEPQRYEAGYQGAGGPYFTYPYLLVQHFPLNDAPIGEIRRALKDAGAGETMKELRIEELSKSAGPGGPVADPSRKAVFMTMKNDYAGVGEVQTLIASFPGAEGIANVYFYTLSDDFEGRLPAFQGVIDSFKFDDGYEFDWSGAEASYWAGIAKRGLVGAAVGCVVGLLYALFRKKKT